MIIFLINYLKGYLKISVYGSYIERFFNICASNNLTLWDIKREDIDKLSLKISVSDYKKLRTLIDNTKCSCKVDLKIGFPFVFKKIKTRYALFSGFVVFLACFYVLTNYLFSIAIIGTEKTKYIYDILEEHNIKIGTKLDSIDARYTSNSIIKDHDDLLFIAINIRGNMATIEVTEREPLPELLDKDDPCDIIADKTGMISSIDVLAGEGIVDVGHTFLVGDVLVSSETTSYSLNEVLPQRYVHSLANIKATIWYNIERVLSSEIFLKEYTGKSHKTYSIVFDKKVINLSKNTSNLYPFYDKIISTKEIKISDSITLPVFLQIDEYIEYIPVSSQISHQSGYDIIKSNTLSNLADSIDGSIINKQTVEKYDNNTISVHSYVETLENVGIKLKR